jgi:hypothetical protein
MHMCMCMCMYVHAHAHVHAHVTCTCQAHVCACTCKYPIISVWVTQADHPFIIQLVCTYADLTHVYFLLTPALGGEVFHQHSSD